MTPTLRLSKLLFVLVLLLTSCQKDDGISNDGNQNENTPDTFSEYFGNVISRDFLGTVVDKNDNPIWGVTITIGNQTTETDVNGVFILREANVYERFGYIKAEKAGYIHGSRSVIPASGTNKVTIMLLEETVVGTVSSGNSDTVTADDGSSVSFDGNFVKEDGTAYTGSVNVIMHHLDPTDEDMEDQMPGMLYAQNEDGAERMLQTLGMLAVELRGSGGEDLNLADGSTSEIKIPVDATLLGSAPATIPLWYFDEATGYWKEEGEATLQGNMYVGTVSHFSFWNCDIPVETVTLCVTATNANNGPINNLVIALTSSTLGSVYEVTNENGEVCGFIPSNEILELSVFSSGNCGGEILLTQTIGSFSTDSDITITVPENPNTTLETIAGTLNTCDGDNVTDGYVQLVFDDQTFTDTVTDGTFEINLLRCNSINEFSLEGINLENLQSSSVMDFDFSSPTIENINLSTCDDFQSSFIVYQFGDYEPNYIIPSTTDYAYDESEFTCNLNLNSGDLTTGHFIGGALYFISYSVTFNNFTGPGIYTIINENIGSDEPYVLFYINNRFSHISDVGNPFTYRIDNFNGTIEVTTFGEVEEFVEYFISGTVDIVRYQGSNVLEIMDEGIEMQGYTRLIRKI